VEMANSEGGQTMCPFCITTIGLIVAAAVSTGGLATVALRVFEKKTDSTQVVPNPNERGTQHAG
jgi:hypothetical protein